MHLVSRALACGTDVRLLGPRSTAVAVPVPSVALTATRTGAGKSQVSRWIALHYRARGLAPPLIRHPMPYGDLVAQRVQRVARLEDLDAAACTIEEREEYELHVRAGLVVWAGVDYAEIAALAPQATVIDAASRVTLEDGPPLTGQPVVVVEDGPTLTHGGMAWGAGTVAAREAGAVVVDARPHAVGALAEVYRTFHHLGPALPALGYSPAQCDDLAATIRAAARAHDAVAVVTGTPIDLRHVLQVDLPVRHASYRFEQVAGPPLGELLDRVVDRRPDRRRRG